MLLTICIQINRSIFLFAALISLSLLSSCGSGSSNEKKNTVKQESTEESKTMNENEQVILFFGNSITAGYRLEMDEAFPYLIQQRLDSLGYSYKVVNAGLSGETTAGGINRIDWVLKTVPDIFVLELGANDGLRGLDLDESKKNLLQIIEKVRAVNPDVKILLTGMLVPPNMGSEYANKFQNIFPEVAEEADVKLLPFILQGVAGNPDLNLDDGIHPTAEGHKIITETIWQALKPMLETKETS